MEIKDFPKLPSATSFIRDMLGVMLGFRLHSASLPMARLIINKWTNRI